jgi:hypothetical protein
MELYSHSPIHIHSEVLNYVQGLLYFTLTYEPIQVGV